MASSDDNVPKKLTEDTVEDERNSHEQEQNSHVSENGNRLKVNGKKHNDSDPASSDHHLEESSNNSEDGLQSPFEQGQNGKGPTKIGNKLQNNGEQYDSNEDIQPLMAKDQTQAVDNSSDKSDDQIEVVVDQNGAAADENPKEADKKQVEENSGEKEGPCRRLWLRVKKIVKMLKIFALTLFSTAMYFFDVGSDIKLAIQYHNEGSMKYFWATLAFIVIPFVCLVVQDLQMVVTDRKRWLSYFPVDKDKTNNNEHRGNPSPTRRCIPKIRCYKTCSLVEGKTVFVIRIVISLLGLGFIVR